MMDDLRVSIIQSDLYWENIDANLGMFEEKIWQIEAETDLIVLPEMFTTGFSMNPRKFAEPMKSKTYRWMKQQAAQTKAVVVGSYIINEGGVFFNRLFVVYPDGHFHFYDKRHLFGLAGENQDYARGERRLIVDIKGWKVLPLICYDLRFPVWSRPQKKENELYEYDVVLYVANWPKPRITSWDTLLAARAIENLSYSVGANRIGVDGVNATYVGHSAVYNFIGERLAFSESEEIIQTELSFANLDLFRSKFPFQRDADDFKIA
ncbi:MAG: omega-amidase [Cyclobacteriaceae bacterium]|jgi:omega-amidase